MLMFKRRKRNLSVPAHVVSADGEALVVEVETNNVNYKKGQIATAIVSTRERGIGGKMVNVSDVVAQGPISDIRGKYITIRSNRNNIIVSRKAALEAKKNKSIIKVNVR